MILITISSVLRERDSNPRQLCGPCQLMRLVRYQLLYPAIFYGWAYGTRTHATGVKVPCTDQLYESPFIIVEKMGLEPTTFCVQSRRSSHLNYDPIKRVDLRATDFFGFTGLVTTPHLLRCTLWFLTNTNTFHQAEGTLRNP